MTEHDPKLLNHAYDGIQEFDNPLPGWWSWIFVLTVVFSAFYVAYYHWGVGPSVHDQYEAEVTRHVEKLVAQLGEIQGDNATILDLMRNEDWMDATTTLFVGNCAQCHAQDGGGNIGPNLTDDYYKNVKSPEDIYTVITDGLQAQGMPPWDDRLSMPQRILLAAYVAHLRGETPAIPKEAEGDRIDDWSTFEVGAEVEADDAGPDEDEGGA